MNNNNRKNNIERISNIKSIIVTYENDIIEQNNKVNNIKTALIKNITRENIVNTIKNQKLQDMSNGTAPINIDYSIILTLDIIDSYISEISNEMNIIFQLQEERKILENNYHNECEYLKYLELSLINKQQELAKYI
jgi:hypothetical protein